jgi:nicotinate-nucleotide pyrophosphorylase (carboxylating)
VEVRMTEIDFPFLDRLIDLALEEDIGPGDITSATVVPPGVEVRARIEAKEPGILAGLPVAERVFHRVDLEVRFTATRADGEAIQTGETVAELHGPARSILSAERTALNFLCRLSGVATATAALVRAAHPVAVFDTRKTTPGHRNLEKYAVRIGGGRNHRRGLYDQVLIKENHIRASGETDPGLLCQTSKKAVGPGVRVEIEVENLGEFESALRGGADIIMLDDMSREETEKACALRGEAPPEMEVSGGVTARSVAGRIVPGLDRVSAGFITQSAPALDLSLRVESAH